MPSQLKIITGKDDESCDWELATQFSAALGADITVQDGQGHTLDREKISQAVASFLKN
jgi:predicted alpha/beta hydrolase family esterase